MPKNDPEQSGPDHNTSLKFISINPIIPQFNPSMPDKQRRFEIFMVILTGLGKILFVDVLDVKFIYIVAAISFWVVYFIWRVSKIKELIKYWGLSFSNAKETFKIVALVGAVVLCVFVIYGMYSGTLRFPPLSVICNYASIKT
ncbi:MAG: hypothetical protein JXB49_24720 [Bacteroidales bacterium]|nr:hypothetical protein [Bacteroidales bacterium]